MIVVQDGNPVGGWRFHSFFGTQLGLNLLFLIVRGRFMLEFDENNRIRLMKVVLVFDLIRSAVYFLDLILTAAVFRGFEFFEQA